jgi:hypothetical protein
VLSSYNLTFQDCTSSHSMRRALKFFFPSVKHRSVHLQRNSVSTNVIDDKFDGGEIFHAATMLISPDTCGRLEWNDMSNSEQCSICCETLRFDDSFLPELSKPFLRLGSCAHGFHVRCIKEWMDAGGSTCPLCRSDQKRLIRRLHT